MHKAKPLVLGVAWVALSLGVALALGVAWDRDAPAGRQAGRGLDRPR